VEQPSWSTLIVKRLERQTIEMFWLSITEAINNKKKLDNKGVIRSRKSKDRQQCPKENGQPDKPWYTKHYTEN
jgi:hypothetical protein